MKEAISHDPFSRRAAIGAMTSLTVAGLAGTSPLEAKETQFMTSAINWRWVPPLGRARKTCNNSRLLTVRL